MKKVPEKNMPLKYGFFIFALIWSATAAVDAQSGSLITLDLETAVLMALDSSEDLKISSNDILRKQSERGEERSSALPQILGQAAWSNNFHYPNIPLTSAMTDYQFDAGIAVTQTLFAFGKISNAIAAAQKTVEASRLNRDAVRQDVIYHTKLAYYNACLARRVLQAAEESYENARQNKTILEGRTSLGRVSKHDNIKISSDISGRMPAVNKARADFASAMQTLRAAIGAQDGPEIELISGFPDDYPDLEREQLTAALEQNQPVLQAAAAVIEEKEYWVSSKNSTLLPEISAFASWNHQGGGNDYDIGRRNLEDYGVAGLKVSVPIWLGGLNREKLSQARIDKKDADLQYRKIRKDYLLALDKAFSEYQETLKTLEANHEAVRWAEESFRYSQELFSSGQISVTDLNDAELQLTNQKINRESTLFTLNMLLAGIERLTLLENSYE